MAIFTILYGNYYLPRGEFKLICIGKFARRTWVNFTQQYGKNRQRCQQNKFIMLYGNYCYIFIENFPQKFSPCSLKEFENEKWPKVGYLPLLWFIVEILVRDLLIEIEEESWNERSPAVCEFLHGYKGLPPFRWWNRDGPTLFDTFLWGSGEELRVDPKRRPFFYSWTNERETREVSNPRDAVPSTLDLARGFSRIPQLSPRVHLKALTRFSPLSLSFSVLLSHISLHLCFLSER